MTSDRGAARLLHLDAVVFDLDGVVRHWNDHELDVHAAHHGLPAGAILEVAFSAELGPAAVTGRLAYRDWMDRVREQVIGIYGDRATPALDRWEDNVGMVDHDMVALLRGVRPQLPIALLSNGTTRLRRDLEVLELADEFDSVFNTAEIGIAKPDVAVFELVADTLGVPIGRIAFTDDRAVNVEGAAAAGMHAHLFVGQPALVDFLRSFGLEVDPESPRTDT